MSVFNVGVIGYGLSAKVFHIPFILTTPGLRLHAIVQRSPQPSSSAPLDHPSAKHYTSAAALIADPDIHVVVITSTPDSHFDITRDALLADKHVLTEKPFVPTSREAQTLADLARARRRLVCVYQNRRWDGDFLLLRHLLKHGSLGRLLSIDTHFDRYKAHGTLAGWKAALGVSSGGTVLFDLGAHLIDQAYVLFGMPLRVRGRLIGQAAGGAWDLEHPDAVAAELVFDKAVIVNVRISLQSVEVDQPRFCVRGDRGTFRSLNLDPQEDQLRAGMSPTDEGYGVLPTDTMSLTVLNEHGVPVKTEVPHIEPETYREFYRQFANSVRSGNEEDVPVKVSDAVQVLKIIEAIIESAKSGRDVLF